MTLLKVLTITLLLAAPAAALVPPVDDPSPIPGTWLMTIQTQQGVTSAQANLTSSDNHVLGGTLTTPNGVLSISGGCGSDWVRIYATDNTGTLIFDGQRTPGAMSGTVTFNGVDFGQWSAKRE